MPGELETSTLANMTRRQLLATLPLFSLACVFPARLASAQDWARAALDNSPRHREYVIIPASSRSLNTYVVYPEVPKKAPVVILIHEIFGLSDWAKLMADELAAKGYIVLAPDLLSGTGPGMMNPEASSAAGIDGAAHADHMAGMAHGTGAASGKIGSAGGASATNGTDSYKSMDDITKAVSGLPPEQVLSDLDAVADFGRKLPSANGKLAIAGFCWGGGKAFALATHRQDIAAAFVFYGPPPPTASMATITAPVYGFYGANDARIDATIPETITAMKAAGKRYEPVTYEGAGHGFMRAGQTPDASAENKKAWQAGFSRLTDQLKSLQ